MTTTSTERRIRRRMRTRTLTPPTDGVLPADRAVGQDLTVPGGPVPPR
ncbi:hypothetical protein ACI78V_10460 [Geodermatophilus sp. SYSU D00742]